VDCTFNFNRLLINEPSRYDEIIEMNDLVTRFCSYLNSVVLVYLSKSALYKLELAFASIYYFIKGD